MATRVMNGPASWVVTSKVKMEDWDWRARRLVQRELKKRTKIHLYTVKVFPNWR
jgi:hypothetical protein